ncbi:hypothetical protein [Streptomyces sp. KR80]|uniref:hypothetical protein n=1 Tax=Streptomyces sp. KR80 TaxID=3457426 RepID=UPI003FD53D11
MPFVGLGRDARHKSLDRHGCADRPFAALRHGVGRRGTAPADHQRQQRCESDGCGDGPTCLLHR